MFSAAIMKMHQLVNQQVQQQDQMAH